MDNMNDKFEPINKNEIALERQLSGPSLTYWQDVLRRLRRNKVAMASLVSIIVIILVVIFVPMFMPFTYSDQLRGQESLFPNINHIFGTDQLGRDMFVRILYGARISLAVGIVAAIINLTIGVLYGGIAGYAGGKVDTVMMRIVDILYSVPDMLYIILLMVVLGSAKEIFDAPAFALLKGIGGTKLISVFIAIGISYWLGMARIVRGQILSLKQQEYVTAARALGAGRRRILFRHLLPNCIGTIIVTVTLQIPTAIFTESFLSFIGLGVDAPMASLGSLASDGLALVRSYPYQLIFPALAICLIILSFNLLGDGLSEALDPRMRK